MTQITYEQIKPYIEKGLISENIHPECDDIRIFNYTQEVQFSRLWDDVTTQCRGLILNIKTGEVVARPFPKFFNYQEHIDSFNWPIPGPMSPKIITEKMDGSLGILYKLNGQNWIATRGSFTSDQAIWATKWYREHVRASSYDWFGPGQKYTALFEIIYPENRIVVNYDFAGLVHIADINKKTGEQKIPTTKFDPAIKEVKRIDDTDLDSLLKLDEPNGEGFVVYYPVEDIRIKIKFPEYVRLHRIITGVNEIAIWEMLKNGEDIELLLEKVPEEFEKWVRATVEELKNKMFALWGRAANERDSVADDFFFPTRRQKAQHILENAKEVSSIVFALLDNENKKATQLVWKMIRPKGK